ncbi:MAG: M48 family metallopeptidase, partial [Bdellovibrionales bacterium]|nr:M48 family metallopeptidase [Bdellovibrionales bacterium]
MAIILAGFLTGCSLHSETNQYSDIDRSLSSLQTVQRLRTICPPLQLHDLNDEEELNALLQRVLYRIQIADPAHYQSVRAEVLHCDAPFSVVGSQRVVVLSSGMLRLLPSEAALAFLFAHELAHFSLGHIQSLGLDNNDEEYRMSDETDADKAALRTVIAAHYNPWAALEVFTELSSQQLAVHSSEQHTQTHPFPIQRRQVLEEYLQAAQWTPPGT